MTGVQTCALPICPTNQTGKYIPIGSMTLDASKNIMMYNGVNWLKINNDYEVRVTNLETTVDIMLGDDVIE